MAGRHHNRYFCLVGSLRNPASTTPEKEAEAGAE
jgi:hypothetical protein